MVLNVEYNISPVTVLTASGSEVVLVGVINYTIVVTSGPPPMMSRSPVNCVYIYLSCFHSLANVEYFLNHPWVRSLTQYIESVLGRFIVEAKGEKVTLDDHVPQVLTQLYAAATKLKCGSLLHILILQS